MTGPFEVDLARVQLEVDRALAEDLGPGDANAALIDVSRLAVARIMLREHAVIAGVPWFDACFRSLDDAATIQWAVQEGASVEAEQVVVEVRGKARALLSAERSALNFLQLYSAVASEAARLQALIAHTKAKVLDTRKTLPGLRYGQKYAVRVGGGSNHRFGLFDAILLKENHLAAAGSLAAAVRAARVQFPGLPLQVEVENFAQLRECLELQVPRVLLDNFSVAMVREAVELVSGQMKLEASGGITDSSLVAYAEAGVDFVSIGALTKHVRAVDLSMRLELLS